MLVFPFPLFIAIFNCLLVSLVPSDKTIVTKNYIKPSYLSVTEIKSVDSRSTIPPPTHKIIGLWIIHYRKAAIRIKLQQFISLQINEKMYNVHVCRHRGNPPYIIVNLKHTVIITKIIMTADFIAFNSENIFTDFMSTYDSPLCKQNCVHAHTIYMYFHNNRIV